MVLPQACANVRVLGARAHIRVWPSVLTSSRRFRCTKNGKESCKEHQMVTLAEWL